MVTKQQADEKRIKDEVTRRVHKIAEKADWWHLTIAERQKYYESWTADHQIGGLLDRVMDSARVRVYLKDTVMKSFNRAQRPDIQGLLSTMSISWANVTKRFVKPQSVLCDGRDLYTMTVAKEWKVAVMTAFERGHDVKQLRRNKVFVIEHTTSRFVDQSYRDMISTAAARLSIEVIWVT
jgi:hypothetical protein